MPSVFPGMDPYLEEQVWTGFHSQFIAQLQRDLAPRVRPKYVTYIEETVYLRREPGAERGWIVPDAFVVEDLRAKRGPAPTGQVGVGTLAPPVTLPLPQEDEVRQVHLEVRRQDTGAVVCIIEVLSPVNKEAGPGREQYLAKRRAVLRSPAQLVELDLLRGGERLPVEGVLPPAAYYVCVSRTEEWPQAGVWPVGLRERLPRIPVPLGEGDPDVPLDLQALFDAVYEAAGYAETLDYRHGTEPPLSPEDAAWAEALLGPLASL